MMATDHRTSKKQIEEVKNKHNKEIQQYLMQIE